MNSLRPAISWHLLLPGCGSVLLLLLLVLHGSSWREAPLLHGLAGLGMGACLLLGLARVRSAPTSRQELSWILGISTALILLGLGLPRSDDVHRYVVEGQQLLAGQNPYAIPPGDARALALVDAATGQGLNHPGMTAIYPPLWLLLSAGVQGLWAGPHGYAVLAALAALASVALVLGLLQRTGRSLGLVLALGWNPLLPFFASGEAHLDMVMVAFLLGAALAAQPKADGAVGVARARLAWALLGAAILVKPFAVVAIPVLFHGLRWRACWVLPSLVAMAWLPFLGAGFGVVASLGTFGTWHFHGALEPVLRAVVGLALDGPTINATVRVVLAASLLGGFGWLWHGRHGMEPIGLLLGSAALLLLCLPTLHAWYLILLAGLLPWARGWALPLWSALGSVYFLHGLRIKQLGTWVETPWVTALAHLPVLLLLLWESRRDWTRCPVRGMDHA